MFAYTAVLLRAISCRTLLAVLLAFAIAAPAVADDPKADADKPNAEQTEKKSDEAKADKPADEPEAKAAVPNNEKPEPKNSEDKKAEEKKVEDKKPDAKQPEKNEGDEKKTADDKPAKKKQADEPAPKTEKPKADKPKPEPKKPEPKKPEPKKPEPKSDLALQGEFVGSVELQPSKLRNVFLHVRGVGHGKFEALQYADQPPTAKNHKPPVAELIGKRHENSLILSGGPWAVMLQDDRGLLVDAKGKVIGSLTRSQRSSPTLGAKPPKHALVLFDGSGTKQFVDGKMTDDGLLVEGTKVMPMFHDFNMHLEFRTPFVPTADGQARGNSGVYLQSRYEVQVLDSFGLKPLINGCGALYEFRPPEVNASLPPMTWQTYDIIFTAPRWSADGSKRSNARITVWHNGIKVHDNVELPAQTGAGQDEAPTLLPIRLQDHKNPVRYRNIWVIDRGLHDVGKFPVEGPADAAK
jgi:hypothetical protein